MQKIEFIKQIETIVERLKSKEIVGIFQGGFTLPQNTYDYSKLNPILFVSKSQFDQIMLDPALSKVLSLISGNDIYNEVVMSKLPHIFRPAQAFNILLDPNGANFYTFHKGMIDTLNVAKKLLSNEIIENDNSKNLDSGVILFTIKIESEGIETQKYVKIFTLLSELVNTLEKAYKLDESESEIVLLDSGSDTNIGLKTKVELAKAIFDIFKEIWDFITSFNFYRNQQKNNALIDSLSIRKQIMQSVQDGILTEEEGKEYLHIIKTRTDSLIGLKVLPRELILKDKSIDSSYILDEYKVHMLDSKKENEK